jgi:ribosome-associated toxin RatA of RatAB toxin-antitoxin module
MSMVQQAIEVSAPLHTVYEQLAAFEDYPRFMSGVEEVTAIGQDQTHWIMNLDGKRREFDARIIERSLDERVSWSTLDGPLLAETITVRPLGETKTQVVAQLEADIAFLMPSDRHGQASLTKRLKSDLTALKGLVESGGMAGASTKQLSSPASVADRIRNKPPHPGAGWGTSAAERSNASAANLPHHNLTAQQMGTNVDITTAPGIRSTHDLDNVLAPGRRISKAGPVRGGAGTAQMGGVNDPRDSWGDGMINEEDRGSSGG